MGPLGLPEFIVLVVVVLVLDFMFAPSVPE
jgi:hypothetical protein